MQKWQNRRFLRFFTRFTVKSLRWDDSDHGFNSPNARQNPNPGCFFGSTQWPLISPALFTRLTLDKIKLMKRTPHQRWYPRAVADQIGWLVNFRDHIGNWAARLGLAPATVTAAQADCNWLIYVLQVWMVSLRTFGTTGTQAISLAQTGSGTEVVTLPEFDPPAPVTGTVPQLPGSLNRIFALVQDIKRNPKRDDEILNDLQIVGVEERGPDVAALAPAIAVRIISGQVFVDWGWGGHGDWLDACEIWVDRGDGKGFVMLTIDTTPGYTDTQAFPTALTKWTYKAIYRIGDSQSGNWSMPVSIAVGPA